MYNKISLTTVLAALSLTASAINIQTQISIKQPGNAAKVISLKAEGQKLKAANGEALPLDITQEMSQVGDDQVCTISISANATTYFNFGAALATGMKSADRTERKLRKADVPVVARINDDRLLLCVRTIFEEEFELVAEALRQ